jgi:hypothetical protein
MDKWRKLDYDKDIQLIPPGNYDVWHDCTIGIKCSCGNPEPIVLDDQSDDSECEQCKKKFRLFTRIQVKEE